MKTLDEQRETAVEMAPAEVHRRRSAGGPGELVDVRTPAEHAAVKVPGAVLLPLDRLEAPGFLRDHPPGAGPIYLLCESGVRARRARDLFKQAGAGEAVVVAGGIRAWIAAGLPVVRGTSRGLSLLRQMQLCVGIVSAAGSTLALALSRWFALVPLIAGLGLILAGATGTCGLTLILARMPWNRSGPGDPTSPSANPGAHCA